MQKVYVQSLRAAGVEVDPFRVTFTFKTFGKNKTKQLSLTASGSAFKELFESTLQKHFVKNGPVYIESMLISTEATGKEHHVNTGYFESFIKQYYDWQDHLSSSYLDKTTVIMNYASASEAKESAFVLEQIRLKLKIFMGNQPSFVNSTNNSHFYMPVSSNAALAHSVFLFLFSDRVPFVKFPKYRVLVLQGQESALLFYKNEKGSRFVPAVRQSETNGIVTYKFLETLVHMPVAAVYVLNTETDPSIEDISRILIEPPPTPGVDSPPILPSKDLAGKSCSLL